VVHHFVTAVVRHTEAHAIAVFTEFRELRRPLDHHLRGLHLYGVVLRYNLLVAILALAELEREIVADVFRGCVDFARRPHRGRHQPLSLDRKSTRLNPSHVAISYALFCFKKTTNELPPFARPPPITLALSKLR